VGLNASSLVELERIRARGQRPDDPVAICDSPVAWAWARNHCMPGSMLIDRRDVRDELTPFVGLDVWMVVGRSAPDPMELAFALTHECRYVTVIDPTLRRPCLFLSSMGARG
jgi:hypothetical protein